jgi:hypothetical protein
MRRYRNDVRTSSEKVQNLPKESYEKLAESVLLQPWFLPRRVAFAMHRLVPADFWRKMRYVFEDYGCLICGTESGYHSNGMCHRCHDRTRKKVLFSARRHVGRKRKGRLDLELFRQQKLARNLLSHFASPSAISPKPRSVQVAQNNPVYEALSARLEPSRRSGSTSHT